MFICCVLFMLFYCLCCLIALWFNVWLHCCVLIVILWFVFGLPIVVWLICCNFALIVVGLTLCYLCFAG